MDVAAMLLVVRDSWFVILLPVGCDGCLRCVSSMCVFDVCLRCVSARPSELFELD